MSAAWLTLPAAPLDGPARSDRTVTRVVKSFMEQEHLSRHPLDDEISTRAMKAFLSGFDPRKMYFLQSDVDEFLRRCAHALMRISVDELGSIRRQGARSPHLAG